MAFVKLVKNNAYYKRYQTRYRRRREGKTDYYARKRLLVQDKDKYNSPKYRLVVRKTNSRVIAQIIYATLAGDKVLCQATSAELKKFGMTAGLTNYAAFYATGLLIARRLLKQLGMDSLYKGIEKADGQFQADFDENDERRPFKAVLDVGLAHTTTGNKLFGCLKGAWDGGLLIPHSDKRFPGYYPGEDGEEGGYEPEKHRERIFGAHVDKYMAELKKEDQDAYKRQFNKMDQCLKAAGVSTVEALVTKVHAEIKKNPAFVKSTKTVKKEDRKHKGNQRKLEKKEREKRIKNKIKKIFKGKQ